MYIYLTSHLLSVLISCRFCVLQLVQVLFMFVGQVPQTVLVAKTRGHEV